VYIQRLTKQGDEFLEKVKHMDSKITGEESTILPVTNQKDAITKAALLSRISNLIEANFSDSFANLIQTKEVSLTLKHGCPSQAI